MSASLRRMEMLFLVQTASTISEGNLLYFICSYHYVIKVHFDQP